MVLTHPQLSPDHRWSGPWLQNRTETPWSKGSAWSSGHHTGGWGGGFPSRNIKIDIIYYILYIIHYILYIIYYILYIYMYSSYIEFSRDIWYHWKVNLLFYIIYIYTVTPQEIFVSYLFRVVHPSWVLFFFSRSKVVRGSTSSSRIQTLSFNQLDLRNFTGFCQNLWHKVNSEFSNWNISIFNREIW